MEYVVYAVRNPCGSIIDCYFNGEWSFNRGLKPLKGININEAHQFASNENRVHGSCGCLFEVREL